jgi:hypothetical protein
MANPPPHPESAARIPRDVNSRRASEVQRRRHLLGRKRNPTSANTGAAIGQGEADCVDNAEVLGACMVKTEVADELPGVIELGWKIAEAPAGNPLAEKVTGFE